MVGKLMIAAVAGCVAIAAGLQQAHAYNYNPDHFASEVVSYVPGSGVQTDWIDKLVMNSPATALGRPTIDTSGDGPNIPTWDPAPVLAVYPAFRSYELVSIGDGGSLVLRFADKVRDNPLNPFGMDLIIYGNAKMTIDWSSYWRNGDPNGTTMRPTFNGEPGIVSVSQDGVTWHTLSNPYEPPFPYGADEFAPTLGRMYEPWAPDASLGAWNEWWGRPTDPTWPLDPAVTPASLGGKTVAQAAQMYGESAGGTAFDIAALDLQPCPQTGMKWIQYVRIENPSDSGVTPEIDAVASVFARLGGDANMDGIVDVADLGILGANYGAEYGARWGQADFNGDGKVDVADLGILGASYGLDNGEYGLLPAGPGAAAVPEPASLALASVAAAGMLVRRRRR